MEIDPPLTTEGAHVVGISALNGKPEAAVVPYVEIYRGKVVVFLMSRRPTAEDFEINLNPCAKETRRTVEVS